MPEKYGKEQTTISMGKILEMFGLNWTEILLRWTVQTIISLTNYYAESKVCKKCNQKQSNER